MTEVKTPDFYKSVSEDETESDEGSKVNNSATSISNRKLNTPTPTSLFNTPESLPSPIQHKTKNLVEDANLNSPTYTQQLEQTSALRYKTEAFLISPHYN